MRWKNGCVCACALLVVQAVALAAEEPGDLLRQSTADRQATAEAIEREVVVQLNEARATLSADPTSATNRLKLLRDTLANAAELSAERRAALRVEIESALRTAAAREAERVIAEQGRAANRAASEDRRRALAQFQRDDEKLAQLTARFNALLDEGRYALAEEVAVESSELADDKAVTASAPLNARAQQYARQAQEMRVLRQKGVVETLHRAEVAHVPQSDEPPIVYVDASEWQELTLRRGEYSTDMHQEGAAELRIRQAIEESTEMEFVDTALGDVVSFLKDRHGIEIQLDTRSLEEAGISSDTPVTINLRGITLRSALRLLLRQFDLTYAVQDEVLFITTPEAAATMLETRVHRVADIVLPVENLSGFGQLGGGQNNDLFGVNPGGQNNFGGQNQNQNQNQQNPFNNQNNNPFDQNGQNLF